MHRILTLILLLLTLNTQAQLGFGRQKAKVTKVSIHSELSVITAGQPFEVALTFKHPKKWHSYYRNPGVIGKPLTVDWTLPEGFSVERLAWPTPHISEMLGYKTFGYEGTVSHLFTITPPAHLRDDAEISITAAPKWQICDDSNCVDEPQPKQTTEYTLKLKTGSISEPNPAEAKMFSSAHKQQPKSTDEWTISTHDDGNTITLSAKLPEGVSLPEGSAFFYDADGQVASQDSQSLEKTATGFILTMKRNLNTPLIDEPGPVLQSLSGILSLEDAHESYSISTPFSEKTVSANSSTSDKKPVSFGKLLGVIGLLFLGGLVLNLMPCVFPVIGIKIMGFVQQSGHDKKKIILHGILFALGVLVSFWALSALLYFGGIRSWGSQLEDPRVIFTLLIVMLLLGMNMYGVFEMGVSATSVGGQATNKDGLMSTFLSGVLATVIATPCAGPFLGGAIGVAVTLPAFGFFAAFTAMAIGLALPYLVLSIFPSLVEKLPRPGAWMTSFKQGMSFLLFATVGFLLWVYSSQVFERMNGLKGLYVMLGLTAIGLAAWIYGRWSVPGKSPRTLWTARILTVIFAFIGLFAAYPFQEQVEKDALTWEKWSPETQAKAVADGRPVFIDFTAKWCLTCQSNKATAYTDEVKAIIKEKNILLLKADKTNPNKTIDTELAKLNRSAIPVNVLYNSPATEPVITREVLTPDYLLDLFQQVE